MGKYFMYYGYWYEVHKGVSESLREF
jgi:hypothetical protein